MKNDPPGARGSRPDRTGFQPYNIFREMEPGLRKRLAVTVFLMFAAIGPLSVLMNSSMDGVNSLYVTIVTLGSGGISASIILFARRIYLLVPAVLLCVLMTTNAGHITFAVQATSSTIRESQPSMVFSVSRGSDPLRVAIGILAMALITAGYVGFIIVLSKEGARRTTLETEVSIAQQIQESLLPAGAFSSSGMEAVGRAIPAAEVGGDFYDIVPLPDGRTLLFLADVAGHGVGAGILAAMTKSAIHLQASIDPSPSLVLSALNKTLREISDRRMFVTAACVLVDGSCRRLQVATAGHPPVLLCSSTAITELRTPSVGLGMKDDAGFQDTTSELRPGDVFLLYSDGLIERPGRGGEQYGPERLRLILQRTVSASFTDILGNVLRDVDLFGERTPQTDDITLLAARIA